ncbi:PREDICTED: beta-defensin 1 [Tinamus guttatus]|uniref:beta-defensin 1 n=1 Tax=Tinamus guttatus TaxID=94827 RepID=UPI00052EC15B|nr:PREDICTED: beta-defensin 1 [Tinamus guttatus]
MSAKAMRMVFLLLTLLLVSLSSPVPQTAAVSDTVQCRKIGGECSYFLCPIFKRSVGTCYGRAAKCCRPFW